MAENLDNSPVAEATIPVKADLSEFNRSVEEALLDIERKMGEAAQNAAKGFADKVGDALDEVTKKLDALIAKAESFKIQAPETQQAKQTEQGGQGATGETSELRDIGRKVDDLVTGQGTIIVALDNIGSRLGNS